MSSKLRFDWLSSANEWRVSDEHRRFLGTITETGHGYVAKGRWVIRTKLFGSREAAARWLEEVAAD
jgi:hypothetical protein